MMRSCCLVAFLLLANTLSGQDSTYIFIQADRTLSEVLTPDKIYQHPQFVKGKIWFRDGTLTEALLNYNFLYGEIEFISAQKDTLGIAKDQVLNIRRAEINGHVYFYDRGFLEQVQGNASGKLVKREMLVVISRDKIGAYNQSTSTTAVESYGSFTDNYGSFSPNLKVPENITLALRTMYFFGDQYNTFLPANKKNLLKIYSSKKRQIEAHLNQYAVNFRNPEDLKKLFSSL